MYKTQDRLFDFMNTKPWQLVSIQYVSHGLVTCRVKYLLGQHIKFFFAKKLIFQKHIFKQKAW